jgi:AraC-like DNA-binding protein
MKNRRLPKADRAPAMSELARIIERHARTDGVQSTPVAGLALLRQSSLAVELVHTLHEPAVCLIVQGAKKVMLNDEMYSYDASRFLIVSVDVPVTGQVTQASPEKPYLCVRLDLKPADIAALILESDIAIKPGNTASGAHALALARTSPELLDAVLRLLRLLDSPEDIRALAPLATQEILYRLLKSEQGVQLHQIATTDGQTQRVARAINWIKRYFNQPLRIEDMARDVHMSASSLHHHFKAVTAMSPLQYQKQLRLQEARRLMLVRQLDAASAAHRVGYESPSQFGREYTRLFGVSPAKDSRRLREEMPSLGVEDYLWAADRVHAH